MMRGAYCWEPMNIVDALDATARELGINSSGLRVKLAPHVQQLFREASIALQSALEGSVAVALTSWLSDDLPDVEERLVRSHLAAEHKPPAELWKKYLVWFLRQIHKLPVIDQPRASGLLHEAERCMASWAAWSRQGRPDSRGSLPQEIGDPEVVSRALAVLRKSNNLEPFSGIVEKASQPVSLIPIPLDLQPPFVQALIERPDYEARLSAANSQFAVIVQGPPGSGKRCIVANHLAERRDRVLWIHVGSSANLAEILERASDVMACEATTAAVYLALTKLDLSLVIDGLCVSNHQSFLPSLHTATRMTGPTRLYVCSSVRLESCSAIDLTSLNSRELASFIDDEGVLRAALLYSQNHPLYPADLVMAFGAIARGEHVSFATYEWRSQGRRAHLSLQERQVLNLLQQIDESLDAVAIQIALTEIRIALPVGDFMAALEARFAVTRVNKTSWKATTGSEASSELLVEPSLAKALFLKVGLAYEEVAWRRPMKGKGHRTVESCRAAYLAIRAMQLAEADRPRRVKLIDKFSSSMRSKGLFSLLRSVCEYEIQLSPRRDLWIDLRLAGCMHAQGDLDAELGVLERAFAEVVEEPRNPNWLVSLFRAVAELLIELSHPNVAIAILDAAFRRYPRSELEVTPAAQIVSTASWALIRVGKAKESIAINGDEGVGRLILVEPVIAKAVRYARKGIAHLQLGEIVDAISNIERANVLFADIDRRGAGWTAIHCAEANRRAGNHELACSWYQRGVEITSAHNTFDQDFIRVARGFVEDKLCIQVADVASQELSRLSNYDDQRKNLSEKILKSPFIQQIIDLLGAGSGIDSIEVPIFRLVESLSQYRMGSRFNRSLVNAAVRDSPRQRLEEIFKASAPTQIFSNPLLNGVITTACQNVSYLAPQYVRPHLKIISSQSDSIRLHYARMFETIGDVHSSEALLAKVSNQSTFNYLNVKANVAARDPARVNEALSLNERALKASRRPIERARILTNMARIFYEHRLQVHFPRAIELCEQAVREDLTGNFQWPVDLLLCLRLESDTQGRAKEVIEQHMALFPSTLSYIKRKVLPGLRNSRSKKLADVAVLAMEGR